MGRSEFYIAGRGKTKVKLPRSLIANLLFSTHILILIYIAFGWLSSVNWVLWGHIFIYLGIELLWKISGSCFLTDWERKIRGITEPTSDTLFMVRIIKYFTRIEVSPEKSIFYVKIWGRIACLISIIKLLIDYNLN